MCILFGRTFFFTHTGMAARHLTGCRPHTTASRPNGGCGTRWDTWFEAGYGTMAKSLDPFLAEGHTFYSALQAQVLS